MTDRFIGPNSALIMNASARIAKLPAIAASNVGKNSSLNLEFNREYLLSYGILVTTCYYCILIENDFWQVNCNHICCDDKSCLS